MKIWTFQTPCNLGLGARKRKVARETLATSRSRAPKPRLQSVWNVHIATPTLWWAPPCLFLGCRYVVTQKQSQRDGSPVCSRRLVFLRTFVPREDTGSNETSGRGFCEQTGCMHSNTSSCGQTHDHTGGGIRLYVCDAVP